MDKHLVRVNLIETEIDSMVEVIATGGATLYLSFDEACDLAQQLADRFGNFAGPQSMREDPDDDPDFGDYIANRCGR